MRRLIACVALMAAVACGSSTSKIGPLEIDPPEGWLVTDRTEESIKVTNGTIADAESTKPGTATAVFDVYANSTQQIDEFMRVLRENNVRPKVERLDVDGSQGVVVSYETGPFGPSTEVLFVEAFGVRAVYRAAFADDSAFARHRDDFRKAIRSIRWTDRDAERPAA